MLLGRFSCFSLSFSFHPSSSPPLLSQLKHMMVMTGYPDFLLKPELIDQEYGVSHELPISLCVIRSSSPHTSPHTSYSQIPFSPHLSLYRCLQNDIPSGITMYPRRLYSDGAKIHHAQECINPSDTGVFVQIYTTNALSMLIQSRRT